LAAGRLDQAVGGVVLVGVRGLDDGVVEVDRLLSGVAYVGDVAGGIVVVVQALERLLVGGADRRQPRQAVGLRIVGVGRGRGWRVGGAVNDALSLATGVVGDLADHDLLGRVAAVLELDALQAAAFVVGVCDGGVV